MKSTLKPLLAILFLTLCNISANAGDKIRFACLPYLQNVTDTEATVIWATDRDAVSWVEVAPDDGSHFYATERPKYFDTKLGKKNIGKIHHVTIKGLDPATTYRYRIFSEEVTNNANANTRYGLDHRLQRVPRQAFPLQHSRSRAKSQYILPWSTTYTRIPTGTPTCGTTSTPPRSTS